jgi:hypothetical protein
MSSTKSPSLLKRLMAKRCDLCPPCRIARAKPDSRFGRLMAWHGKWCPFWQAWQQIYGDPKGPAARAQD